MVRPQDQALYVLQNEFGLIKIGRSRDPERRARALARRERCEIRIVAVLPGCGHLEEATHLALSEFAIAGEWFAGGVATRETVEALLESVTAWDWPFEDRPDGADHWLDQFHDRRGAEAEVRLFRRILKVYLLKELPGPLADAAVHQLSELFRCGQLPAISVRKVCSAHISLYWVRGRWLTVPPYSTDMALAKSLLPPGYLASIRMETPLEVCVAAMELRLEVLKQEVRDLSF
jgi:hypothetical protein